MKKDTLRVFGVLLAAALFVSISVGAVCAGSDDNYLTWTGAYSRNAYIEGSVGPQTNEVLWFNNYTSKTPLPDSTKYDTTPYVDSTPLVYNGNLYYSVYGGTTDSGIYCVNALTGKEVWNYTGDYSRDSMTIDKDVLYVGTCRPLSKGNGSLVALDAATGAKKWSSKQLCTWGYAGISSAPVVSNDVVYLVVHDAGNTTCNDHLYAFNTTTITDGSLDVEAEWTLPLVNEGNTSGYLWKYSSPSLSPDGMLYVPGFGGCAAVNLQSKSVVWKYDAGLTGKPSASNRVGTPVYEGGKIYLTWRNSTSNNVLSVLDAANGKLKASKTSADYISSYAVAVTDSYVVTCSAKGFAVLNKEGLSEKYTLARDSGASGEACSPLIVGNTVYYSSYSKNEATGNTNKAVLNAFSLDTGKLLWTYIFDKGSFSKDAQAEATPAYSDGIIYIATQCGYIYAFYSPEIIYEGIVISPVTSGPLPLKDVFDAAQKEGHFTYNLTEYNTVKDINGIENTADFSKTWMCAYENNDGAEPYDFDDKILPGAKIIYTYDEMETSFPWDTLRTLYKVIITAGLSPDASVSLQSGWNFISVPKALAKPAAENFFYPVSKSGYTPMTWDAENEKWILVSEKTQVTPLTGYWVYAENPTTLYVVYDKDVTSVPASKHVYEGWNAVGVSGTNPMTAETAFANVNWALAHVWNVSEGKFNGEAISPNSSKPTELPQYSGLWLYSNEDKGIPGYL